MSKTLLICIACLFTFSGFSQSDKIIGSWLLNDSVKAMQFFTKADGTIEERTGLASEDLWVKPQRKGKYVFKNNKLVITWSDKSVEIREVKFEDNFTTAKIKIIDRNTKKTRTYLFLRIIDEEVIIEK